MSIDRCYVTIRGNIEVRVLDAKNLDQAKDEALETLKDLGVEGVYFSDLEVVSVGLDG